MIWQAISPRLAMRRYWIMELLQKILPELVSGRGTMRSMVEG
jgi:hypothetical protein